MLKMKMQARSRQTIHVQGQSTLLPKPAQVQTPEDGLQKTRQESLRSKVGNQKVSSLSKGALVAYGAKQTCHSSDIQDSQGVMLNQEPSPSPSPALSMGSDTAPSSASHLLTLFLLGLAALQAHLAQDSSSLRGLHIWLSSQHNPLTSLLFFFLG